MTKHTMPTPSDLDILAKVPALSAYAERVGAEAVNFRKWIVRKPAANGYTHDSGIIIITGDGEVLARGVDPPTEIEAQAIKAEALAANLPKSINAKNLPPDLKAIPEDRRFVFWNEAGDEILFVQERIIRADGSKNDLPRSFWSDGMWRCMEPDTRLPVWGLEKLQDGGTVFIHEGAKGASTVRKMMMTGIAHPWADELRHGVHIGWPGGAPNSSRVDWGPIKSLPPSRRVVLVCDNDVAGKKAAKPIARELQRQLEVVFFSDAFPPGFDLADAFPAAMFDLHGGYHGPRFEDCIRSGTWATETEANDKGKSVVVGLRQQFVDEWVVVVDPPLFFNRRLGGATHTDPSFNRLVRPFSDTANTAALMVQHGETQVDGITYDPSAGPGVVNAEGKSMVNTYWPSRVEPVKGDVGLFLDFMKELIPDDGDREKLLKWCATLIARPDIRMLYAVLLISDTQGIGKGTLMEKILAPLVGWQNVSVPNEKQVTEGSFNSWIAHRRLVLVHEIYAGQSKKAYNNVKSSITDRVLRVNSKYRPEYELINWAHFMCASNSPRALTMAAEDRRWLVPKLGEQKHDPVYWKKLNDWLTHGGLEAIAWWAKQYVAEHGHVGPGDTAPSTVAKDELIEASLSPGRALLRVWGAELKASKESYVLAIADIADALARQKKTEHSTTIGVELKGLGLNIKRLGHAMSTHVVHMMPDYKPLPLKEDDDKALKKAGRAVLLVCENT